MEILECVTHGYRQVLEIAQYVQDAKIRRVPHLRGQEIFDFGLPMSFLGSHKTAYLTSVFCMLVSSYFPYLACTFLLIIITHHLLFF